jgi:arginase
MLHFSIIEAPSTLGLTSTGVELLPYALRNAGLVKDLQTNKIIQIDVPASEKERDTITLLLNPRSIREFSVLLADKVARVIKDGNFYRQEVFPMHCGRIAGQII